jgi:hypothetical protein
VQDSSSRTNTHAHTCAPGHDVLVRGQREQQHIRRKEGAQAEARGAQAALQQHDARHLLGRHPHGHLIHGDVQGVVLHERCHRVSQRVSCCSRVLVTAAGGGQGNCC